MNRWYRVFGTNEVQPAPEIVAEEVKRLFGSQASCKFVGDDLGWYRADLFLPDEDVTFELERFLALEEGIRSQLNTWAAWLETCGNNPQTVRLMQHMISTRQICTLQLIADHDNLVGKECCLLCGYLARLTDGVYQVDGQGFYGAEGTLLVPEKL